MLRRYATFFSVFRSVIDIAVIGIIWLSVYFVRFYLEIFSTQKGIPAFKKHLILSLPIICICYLSCLWTGLYKPKRVQSMFIQLVEIFKASIFSGLLILAFLYYLQSQPYSRKLLMIFIVMLFVGLIFSHLFFLAVLRTFRRRGYNIRYYAVVGAGKKGQELVRDIEQIGWLGLKCRFFIDNDAARIGTELLGVPVYGPIDKLTELVKGEHIDEIYLALGGANAQEAYPHLERLQLRGITVRIIPDWGNLIAMSGATTVTIGSQVLFSAADSPLTGINVILKEIFDRIMALLLLLIFAVPVAIISMLIKLTSKGSVFYKQTRVGMDQKEFEMLKFRTMRIDAEKENGPQWTGEDDPRCTSLGRWLRRMSLDEIPQLINVLKGEMSLTGPRPERPHFVKQFSEEYKKYMLRHKLKAGMTGWAQIHGFRGDTSLRKRLVYDLYYVRNWSFRLDLWILLCTPWHIIKGKNAY